MPKKLVFSPEGERKDNDSSADISSRRESATSTPKRAAATTTKIFPPDDEEIGTAHARRRTLSTGAAFAAAASSFVPSLSPSRVPPPSSRQLPRTPLPLSRPTSFSFTPAPEDASNTTTTATPAAASASRVPSSADFRGDGNDDVSRLSSISHITSAGGGSSGLLSPGSEALADGLGEGLLDEEEVSHVV